MVDGLHDWIVKLIDRDTNPECTRWSANWRRKFIMDGDRIELGSLAGDLLHLRMDPSAISSAVFIRHV